MATAFLAVARRRHDGAAQPGLPRRGVRVLPDRSRRQGAPGRAQTRPGPAVAVAERLGIAVLRLRRSREDAAGTFTLDGRGARRGRACRACRADDIALILHTSGTTSRPKIVPLSHANRCGLGRATSARRSALDRRGPLPQHHAALPHPRPDRGGARPRSPPAAASSARRASTRCSSSSGSTRREPTWYTAVPTMHQAILARARAQRRERRAPPACASSARRRPRCRRR